MGYVMNCQIPNRVTNAQNIQALHTPLTRCTSPKYGIILVWDAVRETYAHKLIFCARL